MEAVDRKQEEKMREKCRQNNIKAYMSHREEILGILDLIKDRYNPLRKIGKDIIIHAGAFPSLDPKLRTRLKDIGTNLMLMGDILDETIRQIEDEDNRNSGGFSKREWAARMP